MARAPTRFVDPERELEVREDTLHKGGVRPPRWLGIPAVLAILLATIAYFIQVNVTGWRGLTWAVAIVAPLYGLCVLAVARNPFGVNVYWAWFRCCVFLKDEGFGGKTLAPMPSTPRVRGTIHVQ